MKSAERKRLGAERGLGRTRELLVSLFVLGVIMFTPPLLIVFNKQTLSLGVPTLYLYLFAVWTILVGLMALVVERLRATGDFSEPPFEKGGTDSERVTRGSSDA